jgi:formylglycine-generating enzyme required for sulfatase activity
VGTASATDVVVLSPTLLRALTPPATVGTYPVSVTTPGGTATRAAAFTYQYFDPPTIASVDPPKGGVAGGTMITLKGTYFGTASSVTIGGVPVTNFSVLNPTTIRAITPPGSSGARTISVRTSGGTATLSPGFLYGSDPGWCTVLEQAPDPSIVTIPELRAAILATGLPWRVLDNGTQIEMILVPAGTYTMGATATYASFRLDELPTHQVTLNSFYLSRYETTQAQWRARMAPTQCFDTDNAATMKAVKSVSWNMVAGTGGFLAGTGLRLPTEAEWEYACRAGSALQYGYSSPLSAAGEGSYSSRNFVAWYIYNSSDGDNPFVGTKFPNQYGLHDMEGNVWEWVNDWYGPYGAADQTNPTGPSTGTQRVMRGGSLATGVFDLRASNRIPWNPSSFNTCYCGFRVARNP